MSAILSIGIDKLLCNRGVESERVEFKASWDLETTGPQVLRTICAFANNLHNLNGGYVVIGVAERDGRAILPPKGLSDADVEAAQKWIRGNCNRIDPPYSPVLSPETVEDRRVLVAWSPASDSGAHRAPDRQDRLRYWIRLGSETVDAERRGGLLTSLLQQKTGVPWDDRPARDASVEDLSETKIREHLRDTRSGFLNVSDTREVCRRLGIVKKNQRPRGAPKCRYVVLRQRQFPVVQGSADRGRSVPGGSGRGRAGRSGLRRRSCGSDSQLHELSWGSFDFAFAKAGKRESGSRLGQLSDAGRAGATRQRRTPPRLRR